MFSRRLIIASLFILLFGALTAMPSIADEPKPAAAADGKCFELRIYTANAGKLEALHKRFRDHTNAMFQKHGMTLVGYWTPSEGEGKDDTLIYILSYPSREAREVSWKAFQADEAWKKAKAESEKDGSLVKKVDSKFMSATDYSPIK